MKSVADRFWQKVAKSSPDQCWEWTAYVNADGYGWMRLAGESRPTHRVSAVLHKLIDSISSPMHVLHKCDNRKCCNPDHLFVGTNADNVADKVAKNRCGFSRQHGESNGMAKLTNKQIGQVRGLYFASCFSQSQLAKQFGIKQPHISRIVNKQRCGGVL
jgi:hypothetical protein